MGKKKSRMERIASKCFRLLPVMALLAAHALADTRKPVANPEPEYPEIARRMNVTGTVKMESRDRGGWNDQKCEGAGGTSAAGGRSAKSLEEMEVRPRRDGNHHRGGLQVLATQL